MVNLYHHFKIINMVITILLDSLLVEEIFLI